MNEQRNRDAFGANLRYEGATFLHRINIETLRELDRVTIITHHSQEVAVLIPYELYMIMQDIVKREVPWFQSEEFYNLMQAYRTAPLFPQKNVVDAFEKVKSFILQHTSR